MAFLRPNESKFRFKSEARAIELATINGNDDPDGIYEVVATPKGYLVAIKDADGDLLGYL